MAQPLHEFAAVRTPLPDVPREWQPYVEVKGDSGSAVVKYPVAGAKESDLLTEAGFDPADYRIKGDINYRKWMRYDQEWLHYYKFDIERRREETPAEVKADIVAIQKSFLRKPLARKKIEYGDDALVDCWSDWQLGKNTVHTVTGVRNHYDDFIEHAKNLRRNGRKLDTALIPATGDILEGCVGHYEMQTFGVDLDRRGQTKVARRLITEGIKKYAPWFERIIIVAVGGNHGENREGNRGKAFTTFADNDDVAVFEQAQEVFEGREAYSHVEFYIADDQLSATVDVKGVPIGVTHGHLASKGGTLSQAKQKQWWQDQWWDENSPAPRAKILITSHYHHLTVSNYGTRTHFQTPAYDGGSKWYSDMSGMNSPDGVLTFVVDPANPLGWNDLRVL